MAAITGPRGNDVFSILDDNQKFADGRMTILGTAEQRH